MSKLAFLLACIAGGLCLSRFAYTLFAGQAPEYAILAAGVFILGIGTSSYVLQKRAGK